MPPGWDVGSCLGMLILALICGVAGVLLVRALFLVVELLGG